MIIDSAYVSMQSARRFTSETKQSVTFLVTQAENGVNRGSSELFKEVLKSEVDEDTTAQLEDSMLGLKKGRRDVTSVSKTSARNESMSLSTIQARCIYHLLKFLFLTKNKESDISVKNSVAETDASSGLSQLQNSGLGVTSYHFESEQTSFSTTGTVRTADGREISFGLNLQMSRSFSEFYEENYQPIDYSQLVDPLVINLDSDIAKLSDQTFLFDLNSDGVKDSIHALNSGSGYLALDGNGDGTINNGSELFGTKSGDGFADLTMYDDDGNGWIDENDEVWKKLLIWTKGEDGTDQLYHLYEKGVGAICLQKASTPYSLNSLNTNETNGVIRNTGVFLYENGNVGTVQHLDVAT